MRSRDGARLSTFILGQRRDVGGAGAGTESFESHFPGNDWHYADTSGTLAWPSAKALFIASRVTPEMTATRYAVVASQNDVEKRS